MGDNSNSGIYAGKYDKFDTGISINTHTCVCLEVNTHKDVGLFHEWQAY
jgi:hypothetical protein